MQVGRRAQHAQRFGRDLRTDAVAREHGDDVPGHAGTPRQAPRGGARTRRSGAPRAASGRSRRVLAAASRGDTRRSRSRHRIPAPSRTRAAHQIHRQLVAAAGAAAPREAAPGPPRSGRRPAASRSGSSCRRRCRRRTGAMMARKPYSASAQGACSRELPQPKFAPAIRIVAPAAAGRLSSNAGIGRAVGEIAPVVEQRRPEAGPLDPLEELLRDDLVGVDVGSRQRDGASGVGRRRAAYAPG